MTVPKMIPASRTSEDAGKKKKRFPLQEIFALALPFIEASSLFTVEQKKAARLIAKCKTGALGYNYYECTECNNVLVLPRSCRYRNCPNCGGLSNEIWIEENKADVIEAPYFHIVFTLPDELSDLCYKNQKFMYGLLMKSAAQAMIKLARDPQYLGTVPGVIMTLHTWGSQLNYHVHAHAIVAGAGLSSDGKKILHARHLIEGDLTKSYFIPEAVIMPVFRGMFMEELKKAYADGRLVLTDKLRNSYEWNDLIKGLFSKNWVVFAKETFNGKGNAIEYLGRYTHRIAISNARIVSWSDKEVTFKYKDYADESKIKNQTLTLEQFVTRFLWHVLPSGFQKVRYYGFLNNGKRKENLARIHRIQGFQKYKAAFTRHSSPADICRIKWKKDIRICPHCGKPGLRYVMSSQELDFIRERGRDVYLIGAS